VTSPRLSLALACSLLLSSLAIGQSRKRHSNSPGDFSYYLLVLSYAPDFCDQPGGNKDPRECGSGRKIGFIVHGLWPQGDTERGPENCGGSPVAQSIIQATLSYMLVPSLIQHEWTTHGTCSGLSAADYFATLRKARDSVNLPADISQPAKLLQLTPAELEAKVATANPKFPKAAIRSSCYKSGEVQEVRVCLTKDLSPRACGSSVGECMLPKVEMLPVR